MLLFKCHPLQCNLTRHGPSSSILMLGLPVLVCPEAAKSPPLSFLLLFQFKPLLPGGSPPAHFYRLAYPFWWTLPQSCHHHMDRGWFLLLWTVSQRWPTLCPWHQLDFPAVPQPCHTLLTTPWPTPPLDFLLSSVPTSSLPSPAPALIYAGAPDVPCIQVQAGHLHSVLHNPLSSMWQRVPVLD